MKWLDRLKNAYNAFSRRDPMTTREPPYAYGPPSYERIDRTSPYAYKADKSVVVSILNRIAVDVSKVEIKHVLKDENNSYVEDIPSGLNNCLSLEANVDQTGRMFIQDIVMSLMTGDTGCIAVCPIDTEDNPDNNDEFDILTLRVGKITQWYPQHVRVDLYNEQTGQHKELMFPKTSVAIIENPFASIMNDPNSTLKRLNRKLAILDMIDDEVGSGKLNMIIQLPYSIHTQVKSDRAQQRKKDIEMQLTSNKYGIAYLDSTEKIIQLNRPLDNDLQNQVTFLTELLMTELLMTKEILNGSANNETMMNYYDRTVVPFLDAITDEFKRKFLSRNQRDNYEDICYFRNPFSLLPISEVSKVADTMIRNEIMTANEMRQKLGMKPINTPEANELRNPNIAESKEEIKMKAGEEGDYDATQ